MDGDSDSSADLFGAVSGVSGPSDGHGAADVSDGRPLALVAMAPRPAPRLVDPVDGAVVRLRQRGRGLPKLNAPGKRSALEDHFVASRMREKRLRLQHARSQEAIQASIRECRLALQNNCVVRRGCALAIQRISKRRGGWKLTIVGSAASSSGGRGGANVSFTPSAMLDLAFDDIGGRNNLARKYNCSSKHVLNVRSIVASSIMHLQRQLTDSTASFFRQALEVRIPMALELRSNAISRIVTFFWSVLRHDSTLQSVYIPIPTAAPADRSNSDVHVLISRRIWMFGILLELDNGEISVYCVPLTLNVSPVPLVSTNATCAYDGLFTHAAVKDIAETECQMLTYRPEQYTCDDHPSLQHSEHFAGQFSETDAASANDKLWGYLEGKIGELGDGILTSSLWCGNHQNNLIECSTVVQTGMERINFLGSLGRSCQYGPNWRRVIESVEPCVRERLVVYRGAPPSCASVYATELRSYMLYHYRTFEKAANEEDDIDVNEDLFSNMDRGDLEFARSLDKLFAVANGRLWLTDILEHFCQDENCCKGVDGNGFDFEVTVDRMSAEIKNTLCRRRPKKPLLQKWTKQGPVLDWYVLWELFAGFLRFIMLRAYGANDVVRAREDVVEELFDVDSIVAWKKLMGKAARRIREGIEDAEGKMALLILALVSEPLRLVTCKFLVYAREAGQFSPNFMPCVIDLASTGSSAVWHGMQYLSALVDGSSSRLVLLWRYAGASSLSDWYDRFPEQALSLRRLSTSTSAWMHERHHRPYALNLPRRAGKLGDHRLPHHERLAEATRFKGKRLCCVPYGLAQTLHQHRVDAATLATPLYCRLFFRMWSMLRGTIADVECRHARNQRFCPDGQSWRQFCSKYINRESQALAKAAAAPQRRRPPLALAAPPGPPAPPCPPAPQSSQPRKRKVRESREYLRMRTPFDLFRDDFMAQRLANGIPFNPASGDFSREVKASFNELSSERRRHYEEQSTLSKSIAKANRQLAKAKAKANATDHHVDLAASPPPARPLGPPPLASASPSSPPPILPSTSVRWLNAPGLECPDAFQPQPPRPIQAAVDPTKPLCEEKIEALLQTGRNAHRRRPRQRQPGSASAGPAPAPAVPRETLKSLLQTHEERSKSVVPDRPLDGAIRYRDEEHCGALCRQLDPKCHRMQARMNSVLLDMIRGSPAGQVPKRDLLIATKCFQGEMTPHIVFAALCAAKGRHGRHKPLQFLISCRIVCGRPLETIDFAGLRLKLSRLPYEPPTNISLSGPFAATATGPFAHFNNDEWTGQAATWQGVPSKIVMYKLRWSPFDGDGYHVLGIDGTWEIIEGLRPSKSKPDEEEPPLGLDPDDADAVDMFFDSDSSSSADMMGGLMGGHCKPIKHDESDAHAALLYGLDDEDVVHILEDGGVENGLDAVREIFDDAPADGTYECMYAYTCICMHACICTHMYACICMHMYACICMHVYACTCMHVYVCMYVYACMCMHIYIYM